MPDDKSQDADRSRVVEWNDPKLSSRDAASISGLDYLRQIQNGRIPPPPIARLVGYQISEIEFGRAVFELEPLECHYNPFATVHGGILTTLLDTAMTAALLSTLAVGSACSTLELKTNFIRPITTETGMLKCEGRLYYSGNRIATAEGRLTDSRQLLYAHGVSTCMIHSAAKTKGN